MALEESIKNEIVTRIKKNADVKKIILFGSYAYGNPHRWSDVDLVVILNEKGFTKTFREKIQRRNRISTLLDTVIKKIPVDVLVYTQDEWNYLLSIGSYFHKEINEKGAILS